MNGKDTKTNQNNITQTQSLLAKEIPIASVNIICTSAAGHEGQVFKLHGVRTKLSSQLTLLFSSRKE